MLLVGKPGVGDAIDSYNLCAAVFEARGLPVLGGVFNKLPETGSSLLTWTWGWPSFTLRTALDRLGGFPSLIIISTNGKSACPQNR